MTVREEVHKILSNTAVHWVGKLREAGAPQIIIDRQIEFVGYIEQESLAVFRKRPELLSLEVVYLKVVKGKGGRTYYQMYTEYGPTVNFYPNGIFGPFIKERKETVMEKLIELLKECYNVLVVNCDCGKCGPCILSKKIRKTLKERK